MSKKTRKERNVTPRFTNDLLGGTIVSIRGSVSVPDELYGFDEIHVLKKDGAISVITAGCDDRMYVDVNLG